MSENKTAIIKIIDPETSKPKKIKIVISGCTLYFNAQHHLIKLTVAERCFFDFLCEKMRESTNDIVIDEHLKENFVNQYKLYTSSNFKSINLSELTKTVPKLLSLGLILDTPQKAFYIVNPKYVFKGSNHSRLQYMKKLIENRIADGLSIDFLVNVPEKEFRG